MKHLFFIVALLTGQHCFSQTLSSYSVGTLYNGNTLAYTNRLFSKCYAYMPTSSSSISPGAITYGENFMMAYSLSTLIPCGSTACTTGCYNFDHQGLDQGTGGSTSVQLFSPISGQVIGVVGGTMGTIAIYNSTYNFTFFVLHTSTQAVSCSSFVSVGQYIGTSGIVGAQSVHVHTELRAGYRPSPCCPCCTPISNSTYDPRIVMDFFPFVSPDLTVINQSLSSYTIPAGTNVTAYCSENNSANVAAGANAVHLWLSSDNVLTPNANGDRYIDYISMPAVPALSNTLTYSKSIQIPNNVTPGSYYLFYWADGGQVVSESVENNNFATRQITVAAPTTSYTITTTANPVVAGYSTGMGAYPYLQIAPLNAIPNTGYSFINWTESSTPVTTNSSYSFNVTANRSLVANFAACSYSLSSNSVTVYSPAASYSFWVYTTSDCNWSASSIGCSWITFTNSTGTGNGMVTFNVSANTGTSPRSCAISVGGQTFTITQNGYVAPCSTAPSPPSSLFASAPVSGQIYVSWAYNSTNVTHFELERALSASGPFSLIASVGTSSGGLYIDINVIPGTTYYYRVRSCCNSNCSSYSNVSSETACAFSVAATGAVASRDTICKGDSIILSAQGGYLGTGAVWTWYYKQCNTGTVVGLGNSIKFAPDTTGYYWVKPQGGCASGALCVGKYITVNQLPTTSIISANGQTSFCKGDSVILSGNTNGLWSNLFSTPSIKVDSSGDYFVTNTNSCGSVTSNHIQVTANDIPIVDAGNSSLITTGNSTSIGGSPSCIGVNPITYNWSPITTLDTSYISNPLATPLATTTYYLTVIDANGCSNMDSVTISSFPNSINSTINDNVGLHIYPNPNIGTFTIQMDVQKNEQITIEGYNTIGQKVYESKDKSTSNNYSKSITLKEHKIGVYYIKVSTPSNIYTSKVVLTE